MGSGGTILSSRQSRGIFRVTAIGCGSDPWRRRDRIISFLSFLSNTFTSATWRSFMEKMQWMLVPTDSNLI